MRSGSSLFTHLLISNPEICGYGETHVPYDDQNALKRVAGKVLYMLRYFPLPGKERFILDKALHNHLLEMENLHLLYGERSHVIFLIREPAGAIASLTGYMQLSREEAVEYYTSRLHRLGSYVTELSQRKACSAFTYDQVVHETKEVFSLLEKQLSLKTPLSEEYNLVRTTGKRGIGDASSNIFQGTIIRNKPKKREVNLSERESQLAWEAYHRCFSLLRENCSMPATSKPDAAYSTDSRHM